MVGESGVRPDRDHRIFTTSAPYALPRVPGDHGTANLNPCR